MLVPRELIGRLLHEPLVQLSRLLKAGFALQASVKGDTDTLQRIAGDDAKLLAETALTKASMPERLRKNMAEMDYDDAMAVGFLTTLQHTAEEMRDRAERVQNSAREEGLI